MKILLSEYTPYGSLNRLEPQNIPNSTDGIVDLDDPMLLGEIEVSDPFFYEGYVSTQEESEVLIAWREKIWKKSCLESQANSEVTGLGKE